MKRPASSKGGEPQKKQCLNDQIGSWKAGVSSSCQSPADGVDPARDKGKGEKWARMRARGEIEPHILDMCDNPPASGGGKRTQRTEIINALFLRQSNGALLLNSKACMFQQHKRVYEEKFSKQKEKLLPRLLFCGKFFNNDTTALDNAVEAGEVFVEKDDQGKNLYGFNATCSVICAAFLCVGVANMGGGILLGCVQ